MTCIMRFKNQHKQHRWYFVVQMKRLCSVVVVGNIDYNLYTYTARRIYSHDVYFEIVELE